MKLLTDWTPRWAAAPARWYQEQEVCWKLLEEGGFEFSAPPKIDGMVGIHMRRADRAFICYVSSNLLVREIHTTLLHACLSFEKGGAR